MAMLTANMVSLASVVVAGVLAYNNKDNWGWFLAVAVVLFCTVKTSP